MIAPHATRTKTTAIDGCDAFSRPATTNRTATTTSETTIVRRSSRALLSCALWWLMSSPRAPRAVDAALGRIPRCSRAPLPPRSGRGTRAFRVSSFFLLASNDSRRSRRPNVPRTSNETKAQDQRAQHRPEPPRPVHHQGSFANRGYHGQHDGDYRHDEAAPRSGNQLSCRRIFAATHAAIRFPTCRMRPLSGLASSGYPTGADGSLYPIAALTRPASTRA